MTCNHEEEIKTLRSQLKNITADFLQLRDVLDKQRLHTPGKGNIHGEIRFTKEDLAEMLPIKVSQYSLGEIITAQALIEGVEPTNKAEFDTWLGVDERGLEKLRARIEQNEHE